MMEDNTTNTILIQIQKIIERNVPEVAAMIIFDLFRPNKIGQTEAEKFAEWLTCECIINIKGEWYYEDGKELNENEYRHTDKTTEGLYKQFKSM